MNSIKNYNSGGTEEQFGYEWSEYNEIIDNYKNQFKKWIYPFKLQNFVGKNFMDAGCGIGRNSYWPLQTGAKSCFAFDFDIRTVNVAKKNLINFKNAKIKYLSIYDLQIRNKYDIVFSIGVIHHLKFPHKAVKNLYNALKPEGTLILWVYAREGNQKKLIVINLLRFITKKLPIYLKKIISKILSYILWISLKIYSSSPYFKLMKTFSLRHLESIILDQLIPVIANYWTKDEVLGLIKNLKFHNVEIHHTNKMSWTLICKK
tara:strand:- start:1783 stop:2565 length:783 start_codon:yes stop_codon:yes gene_type:complete